jgi:hypothetical protein
MEAMEVAAPRRWLAGGPIAAAIVAGVFTLVGAVVGALLDRTLEHRIRRDIWRHEMAMRLVERSMGRWTRARTLLMAAESSVYQNRWDDYIEHGLTRWNQEYLVLEYGVQRWFPEARTDFERLTEAFRRLHEALLGYQRSGGSPPPEVRSKAQREVEATGDQVRAFATVILKAVD